MQLENALNKMNEIAAAAPNRSSRRQIADMASTKISEYIYYQNSGADMSETRYPTAADWFSAQLSPDNEPDAETVEIYTAALEAMND